jgi:small-conductance mechanosensitive channel
MTPTPRPGVHEILVEDPAEIPVLLAALATEWGLRILLALLALLVAAWLIRRSRRWLGRILARSHANEARVLEPALARLITVAGWAGAVALALAILGVDVGALVAALGLGSVALGFALKDTIEQAIGGMVILWQRPFEVGDLVAFEDSEGLITDIGLRATALRTMDGVHVLVPNNRILQGIIKNKSHYPARRFKLVVSLETGSDLAAVARLIEAAAARVPEVALEPAPFVTLDGFGEPTVRAILRYWLPNDASPLGAQTALSLAVDQAAREAGLAIPPPSFSYLIEPDSLPPPLHAGRRGR